MPVGTQATVKTVSAQEIRQVGAQIILSNAYHLYLRPGSEIIKQAGGVGKFMGWQGPLLTDSGGFQIFSMKEPKKITDEGLSFKSHIDGSRHFFTPEEVIRIQDDIQSDIWMPLDQCVAHPTDKKNARLASDRTFAWAIRSRIAWQKRKRRESLLYAIVQGGMYRDLRRQSVDQMLSLDLPGIAIGGLSVGEPKELMREILEEVTPMLPVNKPRYLMGVGYPEDLFNAVECGIDMFDCVVPTRNGRNGTVFYSEGKLLLGNAEYKKDLRPIDENCPCYTCKQHTRSYLRHLFNAKEMLGLRLASLHNLTFFIQLLQNIRRAILRGEFKQYKKAFMNRFNRGN